MCKLSRFVRKGETGFALLSTLVCVTVGSLIIAACLSYVNTAFRARLSTQSNVNGIYAASAGAEDALWCLNNGIPPRSTLPLTSNGNQVSMQVSEIGNYTMYAGEWVTTGSHSDWLLVSGDAVWDDTQGAYKYTITVTWNAESGTTIHLSEVGAKLPVDYTYLPDSAALFGGNLSTGEPGDELDIDGAHLLKWVFSSPRPSVTESDPTKTQDFYITGTGDLEGHYAWVVAQRQDVGSVSELNGTFYLITATATSLASGETTARIEAEAMISGPDIYIISWQVSPD